MAWMLERSNRVTALCAALMLLAAAGCGGDDGAEPEPEPEVLGQCPSSYCRAERA